MFRVNVVRFALLIFTLICVLQQLGCRSLLERESYANPAKERTRPVKITKEWKAEITTVRLEELSLIEDKKTWEIVWEACAEGQTPTVNFDRYMILAVRGVAPNELTVHSVSLNQKNELLVKSYTTFMGSANFCYVFLQWFSRHRNMFKTFEDLFLCLQFFPFFKNDNQAFGKKS